MVIAIPVRLLVFQLLPQEKGPAAPGRSPYYMYILYIYAEYTVANTGGNHTCNDRVEQLPLDAASCH